MINISCQDVVAESESEEFCDEFFCFATELSEEELKQMKRLGL
jgi:hypothetical protein